MAFELSRKPKVSYSPSEMKIFKVLCGYKKPLTTKELVWDFYDGREDRPYHAEKIVGGFVRSLKQKMIANKEPNEIVRIKTPGEPTVEWKIKRREKKKQAIDRKSVLHSPLSVD